MYARHIAPVTREFCADALPLLLKKIELGSIDRPLRALDVGAGTGAMTFLLAEARAGHEVVATDISPAFLSRLRENLSSLQPEVRERVTVADARDGQDLGPLANGRFDVASAAFVCMHYENRVKGIRELLRALRPGGGALFLSWISTIPPPLLIPDAFRRAFPDRELPLGGPGAPAPLSMASVEQTEREIRAAGFEDLEASTRVFKRAASFGSRGQLVGNGHGTVAAGATGQACSMLRNCPTYTFVAESLAGPDEEERLWAAVCQAR
eukprot:tig00020693_g13028.t1